MENKKKHTVTIMLVISLIVIILGLMCGVSVYYELSNQIAEGSSGGVYIDGSDYSEVVGLVGQAGSFVLSAMIVFASFFAVGVQWIVYFIVKLIKNYIAKKNEPHSL
ncbi:MAG: hypothetical protein II931_06350 [Clostridia bacterium]|nr:hypothetical protein [Clostridia bacterium]